MRTWRLSTLDTEPGGDLILCDAKVIVNLHQSSPYYGYQQVLMTSSSREAGPSGRKVLVAVNAGAESENALQWTLENLYRQGDLLHLLHVVPRQQTATSYGAPPIDFLPQMKSKASPGASQEALTFIKERLLPMCGDMQPEPVVSVVKVGLA